MVCSFGHASRGNPKTEEASIAALEVVNGIAVVEQICADELAELRMGNPTWPSPHREH